MEHKASIRKANHRKVLCMAALGMALLIAPAFPAYAEDESGNGKTTLNVKVRATVYPLAVFTEEDCLGDHPKEECTITPSAIAPENKDRTDQAATTPEYLPPTEE